MIYPVANWRDFMLVIKELCRPPMGHIDPIGRAEVSEAGDIRRLTLTLDLVLMPYKAKDEDIPF